MEKPQDIAEHSNKTGLLAQVPSEGTNGLSKVPVQGWDCGYQMCLVQESWSLKLVPAEGLLSSDLCYTHL